MDFHTLQQRVHVGKDKRNEFGGYNYRTAEGILSAIKAALPEGAHVTVTDDLAEVGGQIFVKATATICFADGVAHSASGFAMHPLQKKGMDASQITGAASSYARKYALAGLMALDDGSVDPDARDNRDENGQASAPPSPLDLATRAAETANDADDLKSVWEAHPQLHNDQAFRRAVNARKQALAA